MLGHRTAVDQARERVGVAQAQAHDAAREASPWIERLSRLGYAAKGTVYVLVGVLAAQAAAGVGGDTTDTRGALAHVLAAPFGQLLLAVIALGLAGYALWCFVQAALDCDDEGSDLHGLAARVGHAGTGVVYVGLVVWAVGLLVGANDGSAAASDPTRDRTAWLMAQPFGAWLVGLAGAIILGVGLHALWQAWRSDLSKRLHLQELSATQRLWVTRIGRAGYAAHGVTLGLIGGFVVVAAVQAQPDEARGLGGALAALAARPEGPGLLGLVAAGLVAYGLFMFVQARYRDVTVS
ncbi:MAG TPA: DUF1206 domain-containing protein [Chloroflexota bacterium]|nr:DUF1206 domain-containing protein [Chloroflexota bacterium]